MSKALKYWAVLIGAYIVVANSTGFGRAIKATGDAGIGITKALQGPAKG